jgi:hypothetical protein
MRYVHLALRALVVNTVWRRGSIMMLSLLLRKRNGLRVLSVLLGMALGLRISADLRGSILRVWIVRALLRSLTRLGLELLQGLDGGIDRFGLCVGQSRGVGD